MQTKSNIPVFKIEKPEKVSSSIGKLSIPRTTPENLGAIISQLMQQAAKAGVKAKVVKGTLTLY